MDTNGWDWVRCVLWINKSRCVLCFVLAPGYAVSVKSRAHLIFFLNLIFTVRIVLLYLLLQFPPSSPVSSTAHTIYSFFEVDDVIPFCLL